MTDAERIWREKSDDDLLTAAAELSTYTEEGQRIIREELRRRGLEDPVEQAEFIVPEAEAGPAEGGAGAAAPVPRCVQCHVAERYIGARRFRQVAASGLSEAGSLGFAIDQAFDVFVCPRCGHVDLYVDGVGGDTESDEAAPTS